MTHGHIIILLLIKKKKKEKFYGHRLIFLDKWYRCTQQTHIIRDFVFYVIY